MRGGQLYERLARKLRVVESGCWEWTGAGEPYGHITTGVSDLPRQIKAHRAMFWIVNGYLPPVVRHTCDNPPCCNPAHLEPGTHTDNMRDMAERGRSSGAKKQLKHGTQAGYSRGCRCDGCRTAWRERMRKLRADLPSRGQPVHGLASTYGNYGCRCAPCTAANSRQSREYKAARRQAKLSAPAGTIPSSSSA